MLFIIGLIVVAIVLRHKGVGGSHCGMGKIRRLF